MPEPRSKQPGAILRDSEKALRLYKAADFDRFDELCTTSFWVRMTEVLREQLLHHSRRPSTDDWAAVADGLMAAGDRLAEKLREIDASPWSEQILAEWVEAKRIEDML